MKKSFVVFFTLVAAIGMSSCKPTPKPECLVCEGCFSSWEVCESEYTGPMPWEEYRDSLLNMYTTTTIYCTRKN